VSSKIHGFGGAGGAGGAAALPGARGAVAPLQCETPVKTIGESSSPDSTEAEVVLVEVAIEMADLDNGREYTLKSLVEATERLIDVKYEIEKETKRETHRCQHVRRHSSDSSSSSTNGEKLEGSVEFNKDLCSLHLQMLTNLSNLVSTKLTAHSALIESRRLNPCANEYPDQPAPKVIPWAEAGQFDRVIIHAGNNDGAFWKQVQAAERKAGPRMSWQLPQIPGVTWASSSSSSEASDSLNWRDARAKPIKYVRKNWGALLFRY